MWALMIHGEGKPLQPTARKVNPEVLDREKAFGLRKGVSFFALSTTGDPGMSAEEC
jgi:hypothetical protein